MKFQEVGISKPLVSIVVDQIEGLISNGKLKPNTLLPSQKELAIQFGVSRTVIREAMRILETKGLIEVNRGFGAKILQLSTRQIIKPLEFILRTESGGIRFDDLHQVREILEVEIAKLAAAKATELDITRLKQLMIVMNESVNNPMFFAETDADFHAEIAKSTQNPLLFLFSETIRGLLKEYLELVVPYLNLEKDIIPYHTEILESIMSRDEEGAFIAMKKHLDQVKKNHEAVLCTLA
jgi:GntR family transcriptional regulator, transcriptional repressor for pyruvate dehydrogenase complex